MPRAVKHGRLTTLREKLIKIGANVVRHARQVTFRMAEVAAPRDSVAARIEVHNRRVREAAGRRVRTGWHRVAARHSSIRVLGKETGMMRQEMLSAMLTQWFEADISAQKN